MILLESVFVSCKVKKYNKFDWKQDRVFAVTEKHIYNIKGKSKQSLLIVKELRRKVPLSKVSGMTLSKDAKSNEMVIHVSGECDFRIKAEK